MDMLNRYKVVLDWKNLSGSIQFFDCPLNDFLETYRNNIDWDELSRNKHFWDYSYMSIELYVDQINWDSLCGNQGVRWYPEMIEEFEKFINWNALSLNPNIVLTEKIFHKYQNQLIDNRIFQNPNFKLSRNSLKLIKERAEGSKRSKYFDSWYFHRLKISGSQDDHEYCRYATWSDDFMYRGYSFDKPDPLIDALNMENIYSNSYVPWNIQFILRYLTFHDDDYDLNNKRNYYWEFVWNESAWVSAFKPYVDEKLIVNVIERNDRRNLNSQFWLRPTPEPKKGPFG
ncbi:MAG: hypothetical protein HOG34_00240 [Bacteroidetes bacterium]|nr:hypothetical protein [Bacteroidota bacterium]